MMTNPAVLMQCMEEIRLTVADSEEMAAFRILEAMEREKRKLVVVGREGKMNGLQGWGFGKK